MGLIVVLMGGKLDRLSPDERAHWRALRIFVEKRDQKRWLKLKTEEERNAWLQEQGLWDRFYQHNASVRDQIVAGDVRLGWSRQMLYMAWGIPTEKLRLAGRNASRSEMLVYQFEVDPDNFITVRKASDPPNHRSVDRYQVNVAVDDDVVAKLIELNDWQ